MRTHLSCLLAALLATSVAAGEAFVVTTPGKPGTGGVVPTLSGSGPLTPGSTPNALHVADALPNAPAVVVLGLSELAAPFQGGVLGPAPDKLLFGLGVDADGQITLPVNLPADVPAGLSVWTQFWLDDPGAVLGRSASNTLKLTVQAPLAGGGLFPGASYPTPDGARSLVAGDVTGDGVDDLLVTFAFTDEVLLWRGDGVGGFGPPESIAVGGGPKFLALADLDVDGALDLVVVNADAESVSVLLGDGAGAFSLHSTLPSGPDPTSLLLADVDGDGAHDLLVGQHSGADGSGRIMLRPGLGDGGFGPRALYSVGQEPNDLSTGDLDGDGILDVAVLCDGAVFAVGELWMLRGLGAGSFAATQLAELPLSPEALVVSDLNGDAVLDVAVAHQSGFDVGVWLGLGGGAFAEPQHHSVGVGARDLAGADLDGDGVQDLAVAASNSGEVAILIGLGDGDFEPAVPLVAGEGARSLALTDVDADGDLDVAVVNGVSNTLSVIRGHGDGSFASVLEVTTHEDTQWLAVEDVDGDGALDLIAPRTITIAGPGVLDVRFGHGDGSFEPAQSFPAGPFHPASVQVVDLNLDGNHDLVAANPSNNTVCVLLGEGGRSFGAPQLTGFGFFDVAEALDHGDLDGDGVPDLVVVGAPVNMWVLLGAGDGSFEQAQGTPSGGSGPTAVRLGDLDRDGVLDVVVVHRNSDDVSVRLGLGDGSFGAPQLFAVGDTPFQIELGDVDGDLALDVIVANELSSDVWLLRGDGRGGLEAGQPLGAAPELGGVAVADLDADGMLDLVFSSTALGQVSLRLGVGGGSFGAPSVFAAGPAAGPLFVGDVDGDGALDLLVERWGHEETSVLLNQRLD